MSEWFIQIFIFYFTETLFLYAALLILIINTNYLYPCYYEKTVLLGEKQILGFSKVESTGFSFCHRIVEKQKISIFLNCSITCYMQNISDELAFCITNQIDLVPEFFMFFVLNGLHQKILLIMSRWTVTIIFANDKNAFFL